jgi:hypothetical protein
MLSLPPAQFEAGKTRGIDPRSRFEQSNNKSRDVQGGAIRRY